MSLDEIKSNLNGALDLSAIREIVNEAASLDALEFDALIEEFLARVRLSTRSLASPVCANRSANAVGKNRN